MTIEIKFRDDEARSIHYYLKRRYNSRASLDKLAKTAIREIAAEQVQAELRDEEIMEPKAQETP